MECLIVGGGAAGLHAALMCRQCWPEKSVTLIEAEAETGYYRTLLPQFMVGQMEEEKLFFWKPGEDSRLKVRAGLKVESLDRINQCLRLENNEKLRYERLVLAPGGRPLMPGICADASCRGIFPVRDLTTARKVREWLDGHREIVVLGGGLVGLKTAVSLRISGFKVSLVEKEDHLLPRVLSSGAARPVEDHLRHMGMSLFLGCSLEDIRIERGSLKSVRAGSQWLPCATLMVAIGSSPDVGFLKGSGLLENEELVVSPTLQTRDEIIYAAGDAVSICNYEGEKFSPWTWPQAVSQGKLASGNLYRPIPLPLNVLTRPNSMNLHGLSIVILGPPVEGAEVIHYTESADSIYRELFIRDGRIVGGALVGDISGAGTLHAAMTTGKNAEMQDSQFEFSLLQPRSRVLSRFVGNYFGQRRRARLLLHQE
ncbi:MAG: NAD(P)/FAD-dependent oxidoreductase [Deltaproteobacteria bacterium]|nr:NAD(P)/FAD-dependent oxidoreductase [Deltaproteobacteria bacterium]